jgi:glycosyltransferase involved in cell wall biosynthesis
MFMSDQPFVSFIVLAYRQEKFIREAVQSALAQTYENLEIVLSDDRSPDQTFQIMAEVANHYKGSHRLILNRNPENLGLAGNLNRAVQLASGDLLVLQGGDDISLPARTSRLVQRWVSDQPRRDLVYSDAIRIAADGSVLQQQIPPLPMATLEEVARGKFFLVGGCVAAYSRSLFEKYGPLNSNVQYEDYVLTFRALLGAGCAFIDEPLIYYRVHENSIVQSTLKAGKTRRAAARWAKHAVAEAEDRLRSWDLSGKRNPYLRWLLARNLVFQRLDARSSTGSRLAAFGCFICAIGTGRPNAAWTFLRRDVLNWKLQ